jgi:hypothetical protein
MVVLQNVKGQEEANVTRECARRTKMISYARE